MAKKVFPDGTEVAGFYVRTIRSGPFVFVSGTTSLNPKGQVQGKDAAQQTTITMRKIEAGLKSAGAKLGDLVRTTIYVTDIRDMGAVSAALAAPKAAAAGSDQTNVFGLPRSRSVNGWSVPAMPGRNRR